MTLFEDLTESLASLIEEHKLAVKSVGECEIRLGIARRHKMEVQRKINSCKADLAKIEGNRQ